MHPALRQADWPAADQEVWAAATQPKRFLQPAGRGAGWRPESRRALIGSYGRWLAWLRSQGVDLAAEPPAERFTVTRLEAYVAFLATFCAPVTVASYLGILCMAAVGLFPERDWEWLRVPQRAARARAVPSRLKHVESAADLFQLGIELVTRATLVLDATCDSGITRQRLAAARDFRDGLIIALLASRPLRLKNLVEMEIGRQLRRTPGRSLLQFTAAETKTHAAIHYVWPERLEAPLSRYLQDVRPMLIAANPTGGNRRPTDQPGARLWVGQGGTALFPAGVNRALERHTSHAFGHALTAHRFRDSVASSIANDDPNRTLFAAQMLGHKRVRTTERHYIIAHSDPVLAGHHDRIQAMRKAARRRQLGSGARG